MSLLSPRATALGDCLRPYVAALARIARSFRQSTRLPHACAWGPRSPKGRVDHGGEAPVSKPSGGAAHGFWFSSACAQRTLPLRTSARSESVSYSSPASGALTSSSASGIFSTLFNISTNFYQSLISSLSISLLCLLYLSFIYSFHSFPTISNLSRAGFLALSRIPRARRRLSMPSLPRPVPSLICTGLGGPSDRLFPSLLRDQGASPSRVWGGPFGAAPLHFPTSAVTTGRSGSPSLRPSGRGEGPSFEPSGARTSSLRTLRTKRNGPIGAGSVRYLVRCLWSGRRHLGPLGLLPSI